MVPIIENQSVAVSTSAAEHWDEFTTWTAPSHSAIQAHRSELNLGDRHVSKRPSVSCEEIFDNEDDLIAIRGLRWCSYLSSPFNGPWILEDSEVDVEMKELVLVGELGGNLENDLSKSSDGF